MSGQVNEVYEEEAIECVDDDEDDRIKNYSENVFVIKSVKQNQIERF
jgi:hypothetical protein